jgi:hypothetical protein
VRKEADGKALVEAFTAERAARDGGKDGSVTRLRGGRLDPA